MTDTHPPRLPTWLWALASHRLPGTLDASVDDHLDANLGPEGWGPRLELCFRHGLAGLLDDLRGEGRVRITAAEHEQIATRLEDEARLAVRLEAELARLAPVLDRHRAVVLKGAALAHGAYPDPRLRPFTDLDLLVAPEDIERTIRDLERAGYERPRPDPAPGYAARVAKATVLVHPSGLIVDLHRTLASGTAGHHVGVPDLLDGRIEVAAGRIRVPALDWPAHLVAVCLHASIGDGLRRALSVRDVAQVAALAELDAAAALDLATAWGVQTPVTVALRAARDQLGAALPEGLDRAADRPVGAGDLSAFDASTISARTRLEDVRHGPGLRTRCTIVRSLVVPTPSFLRWTYGPEPLPRLYLRRWSDLRHRTAHAGGGS